MAASYLSTTPHLPADVVREILENLSNDKKTLYSALFVNHDWCRTTVPILWRNPFEFLPISGENLDKVRALLRIYFTYVTGDDLAQVKIWNVRIPKLRMPLAFDYIACLQTVNDRYITNCVNILFPNLTEGYAYPIGHNLVCYALMKQMLRKANSIADISLSSHHWSVVPTEQINEFFFTLRDRHPKIHSMHFRLRKYGSLNRFEHLTKYVSCITESFHKLKHLEKIELSNIDVAFPEVLQALATRPKTLKKIRFRYCCFYAGRHLFLKEWNDLESLEEIYSFGCHHLVSADLGFLESKMHLCEKKELRVKLQKKQIPPQDLPKVEETDPKADGIKWQLIANQQNFSKI